MVEIAADELKYVMELAFEGLPLAEALLEVASLDSLPNASRRALSENRRRLCWALFTCEDAEEFASGVAQATLMPQGLRGMSKIQLTNLGNLVSGGANQVINKVLEPVFTLVGPSKTPSDRAYTPRSMGS